MPIDYKKYPKNWKLIRKNILIRSNNTCEFCGAKNYQPHPVTCSKVILTIAHLDHDINNNNLDNLKSLCQRCHLQYDQKQHKISAALTRKNKKIQNGQLEL